MRYQIYLILICTIIPVNAWTFHGDVQRTGNFTEVNGSDLIWKTKIGGLVDSSPVVENGKVFVISWYGSWYDESSKLSCLYAENGTEIWNVSIEGASTPTVYRGKVVVGSLNGKVYCLNASNGKEIWNLTLERNPGYWGISSSPLIYNDTIYITTFSNGTLWALDLNGSLKWKVVTGGEICPYTSPSLYKGDVLFAGNFSGDHELVCVNESGKIWSFPVESKILSSIAIANGNAYFTTEHRIYALNLTTHSEIWNLSLNGTISTPAIAYDKIFVGDRDGFLHCFDLNGNEIWSFKANGKIDSSPAIGGGKVYFATNIPQGTIYALNLNGSLAWKYTLIPPEGKYYNVMSSPFIWNGKLFIGADDGNLYCFGNFSTIWEGEVKLTENNVTINTSDGLAEIRGNSALYALIKASEIGGFEVDVEKTSYGLYVRSIAGIEESDYCGWLYWVNYPNEPMPVVGSEDYILDDNDTVLWYYGCYNPITQKFSNPPDSDYVVKIRVRIPLKLGDLNGDGVVDVQDLQIMINLILQGEYDPLADLDDDGDVDVVDLQKLINIIIYKHNNIDIEFTVSSAKIGGNATAHVKVSSLNGWYVVVVSGLNDEGDYIAGISTFYLNESLNVPVIIHVPQRNTVGVYKLYAGIYRFEDYPNELIDWFGPVDCEVYK